MDKRITTEQIVVLLKKAAKIKDKIVPLCSPEKRWQGRTKGWALCPKCYPSRPERLTEKSQLDKLSSSACDSLTWDRKTQRDLRRGNPA
jgi:transposase